MKVSIDSEYLEELLNLSIQNGTEMRWMIVAMDWAKEAEKEITRLQELQKYLTLSCKCALADLEGLKILDSFEDNSEEARTMDELREVIAKVEGE